MVTLGTKTKVIWNYKGKTRGYFCTGLKLKFANLTGTKNTFYPASFDKKEIKWCIFVSIFYMYVYINKWCVYVDFWVKQFLDQT
jgi:hypothetical protein